MKDNNELHDKSNTTDVPLHGTVKYPVDPRVVEYFRLTPNGTVTPNYENLAKHFNAANNLRVLTDVANNGVHRPNPLPVVEDDAVEEVKEAAMGATEDVEVDEVPDYQRLSEEDIKDLEGDPNNKKIVELLRKDPVKTRKFEEYVNNETVNDDPSLTATHAMLADVMGMNPVRETRGDGPDKESVIVHTPAPSHQMVHELAGLMDEELEEGNDKAATKLVEGLNRAMNIFIMQKGVKKNLAHDSAEDLLQDFATFMYDQTEFRKMLNYYRKAGNHRFVDEDGKPSPKKPDRNNRYLWVGVPHGDSYFSGEAQDSMAVLRKDFDKFMEDNSDPGTESQKIRVEVLEPSMAANVNPVQGAMAGVVLKVGGKTYHFNKVHEVPAKEDEPVVDEQVKTASDSLKGAAAAFANRYNTKEIFTSRGPSKDHFGELVLAWLTKLQIENGKVPAVPTLDVLDTQKMTDAFGLNNTGTPEQVANRSLVKKWYDSGSTTVPMDVKEAFPWLFEPKGQLYKLASHVAGLVDDLAFDAMSRSNEDVQEFTKALVKNLGSFLSRVATEVIPDNLNNWIEGVKYQRTQSVPAIGKQVIKILKDMLAHPVLSVPGESRWLTLVHDFEKEGDHSILSTGLKEWGKYLLSDEVGLEEQGVQFYERPAEYADDLVERIIKPSLHNEASEGQILSYVTKAVQGLTGDINFDVPLVREGAGGKSQAKEKSATDPNDPYLNVVYLSGEKPTSDKNRKGITLQSGNAYDLIFGPGSAKEDNFSGAMEDKDHGEDAPNVKFSGYVLQVEDGRRVIDLEEARLSSEEIPRFIEFAANNYTSRFLDKKEKSMASTGTDESKLKEVLESQDSDMYQEELDARQDPIWEHQMANLLKGKSLADVQEILKKINGHKDNHLTMALHRQFGSPVEKDVNGGYKTRPNAAQEVLSDNPNSEYKDLTHERTEKVVEGLTKEMPSLNDMDMDGAQNQKELFELVKDSKEVAEKFVRLALETDASLATKKNGTANALHGVIMDSNYDRALKETLLEFGLSGLLDDLGKGSLSKAKAGHRWADISKMVQTANKEQAKVSPKAYAETWDKAKNSDPKAFGKIFVPDKGLSIKSQMSDEELREFLEMVGDESPHLMEDDQFKNIMIKEDAGGIDQVSVRDETLDGDNVNVPALKNLVKHLSDVFPDDVMKALEANDSVDDYVSKDSRGSDAAKYRLRTDAKVSDFKEFMDKNRKPGQLGHMLDPTGKAGASLGSGASRYRIRAPRTKGTSKDKGTQTGLTRAMIHKHLDGLLDKFKDKLEVSPDAAKLVTEGKGIARSLQGGRALTRGQRNLTDITSEVKKVLKHSDNVLDNMKEKQENNVDPDSRQTDYDSLETKITKKKKDLVSWLHRSVKDDIAFDLETQKEILELVNQLISSLDKKGAITDDYLNREENIKALEELAKVQPKRAR